MASDKVIELKKQVIDEIKNNAKESSSVIFFEYSGLSVAEMKELRNLLRENDSDVKVYKNTLTKRALDELDINLEEHMVGPKAMAYSKDQIAPIKVLYDFAKKHEALELKVGYVDGEIVDKEKLNKLAQVPSRDVLLTMFAQGMMGVVKEFAVALDLHSQNLEEK